MSRFGGLNLGAPVKGPNRSDDSPREKGGKKKMNKKLAMLLIPLLLVPLASFAYAHYEDNVDKKYKVHVGSVVANLTYFHVDKLKTIDTNCNGIIWGDEVIVNIFENPADCTWYVQITLNPIPPSFEFDTTLMIHNAGKLPWEADWEIMYAGPFDNDYYGCFEGWDEREFTVIDRPRDNFLGIPGWYFENGFIYDTNFYKFIEGAWRPVAPTSEIYHPCTELKIQQNLTLLQPPRPPVVDPNDVSSEDWQKNIQCHWFLIWIRIKVKNPTPQVFSSATWEDGAWTGQGNIP
jgi:hypothetical protein